MDSVDEQSLFDVLNAEISDESLANIKAALDAGADVNVRNKEGNTPLMQACLWDSPDCVKMLLEAGADVEVRGRWGYTPLINLARSGYDENSSVEIARLFIEAGVKVNAVSDGGVTALMEFAYGGWGSVVQLLLDNGADIEMKDCKGKTVKEWAAAAIEQSHQPESFEVITRILKEASEALTEARQREAYTKDVHRTAAQRQAMLKKMRPRMMLNG